MQKLNSEAAIMDSCRYLMDEYQSHFPGSGFLGFAVQRSYQHVGGIEFSVGITRDPLFGPLVVCGAAGAQINVMTDRQIALPPLNMVLARELLRRTYMYKLLKEHSLKPEEDIRAALGHRIETHTESAFDPARSAVRVRETISLTGQFAAVDDVLTGRENLALVARLRHLPDPRGIADALLARFGLTDAGTRPAGTYSGGMKRRLDIAMSLIGNPPVIVLDEPTTGLDPQARIEVWDAVRELAAGGATVLLTTQYLDEAEHLADRIAILHEGRIIAGGTLAELKALLPPATVEYVERQPTLEDVFLAIIGTPTGGASAATDADTTTPEEAK